MHPDASTSDDDMDCNEPVNDGDNLTISNKDSADDVIGVEDCWYMKYEDRIEDYDYPNVHLLDRDVSKSTYDYLCLDFPNPPNITRHINAVPMKKLITDEFRYQYCHECGKPGGKVGSIDL
ncbi:hypothetical protein TNIN_485301 [Trichonephila inaurata madagascariensis]|uniref:Uncharacterized protein n=1 Tax=Trichonephila inaurata madagascariensis TaxID=2747483 RepID=A0A8X6IIF3_9ARAC|nr:hypothetical protein TNIN_485301 [Trichonephila inaurata madagascariensis]